MWYHQVEGGIKMNVTISKEKLLSKLDIASKFVASGRTDMPISKCFLITVKSDAIYFDASNFESGCKIRLKEGFNVIEEGRIVIEAKKFQKLIKTMSADEVNFETSRGSLRIRELDKNPNSFNLALIDGPDKFPTMPFPDKDTPKITVDKEKFLDMIKKVSFAAQDPKLSSSSINSYSKMIHFCGDLIYATNTHKIGALSNPEFTVEGLHLPKDSVTYFRDLSNEFDMYLEENMFYVQDGDLFFIVKNEIIKAPTEKVRQFLQKPVNIAVSYTLSEDELKYIVNTLKQFKILNESVIVYITEDTMWLGGVNYEVDVMGSFDNSVKGIKITPDEFNEEVKVTFNIQNLTQILQSVTEPEIVFRGSYDKADSFIRIFEDNYQGILQRLVANHEELFVDKIKEDYIGN